jgi:AcrR family transcriptional regulator
MTTEPSPRPKRVGRPRRVNTGEHTSDQILDVAEHLFAEQGVDGTSLRQIMKVAEVSISLINYHFGDKEGLLRAIFERKIIPSNKDRLGLLEEYERRGTPLTLGEILRAYIVPTLKWKDGKPDNFMRLLSRIGSDDSEMARCLTGEYLDALHHRFMKAFAKVLPDVSEEGLYWRIHILLCVIIQTTVNPDRIRYISGGMCDPRDPEATFQSLLPMLSAAMLAPDPSTSKTKPPRDENTSGRPGRKTAVRTRGATLHNLNGK